MNIALIAHDAKKELMVQFCIAYCGILSRHNICATGTTGKMVAEADVYKRQAKPSPSTCNASWARAPGNNSYKPKRAAVRRAAARFLISVFIPRPACTGPA